MAELAIIGGTGLTELDGLEITHREVVASPFGEPSGPVVHGRFCGTEVTFMARHGHGHTIPPHQVNYRANLWALRRVGVRRVLSVAAVGGIREDMIPGGVAIPDQILDYTWGRDHTFFEGELKGVTHIDFTQPYCPELRQWLLVAAKEADIPVSDDGTYGATQGPRLETAAEIDKLERDGCDIVGMTGMPEAALARELGLSYACCAVIANHAAGRGEADIHADIEANLNIGLDKARAIMGALLKNGA
ncbi:5'-deoxy-5'-methylthioadenosine phosphorylase [Natronospira proteinivora]|uniref:Probable 6-oxopurine nucleoside phosphorylase n=1 Tax=Natronospira proteinivora TaxID=1807133 RepID=A0ABT1G5W4_9GAMM|nr:S-methyl-5'-thioinosine phosphorylase [Natronospira proteinivora]MCP1726692.1 5'-deoxy-5'-methylthioadenosine phosphorylase [Natronospira proteinivora]